MVNLYLESVMEVKRFFVKINIYAQMIIIMMIGVYEYEFEYEEEDRKKEVTLNSNTGS